MHVGKISEEQFMNLFDDDYRHGWWRDEDYGKLKQSFNIEEISAEEDDMGGWM